MHILCSRRLHSRTERADYLQSCSLVSPICPAIEIFPAAMERAPCTVWEGNLGSNLCMSGCLKMSVWQNLTLFKTRKYRYFIFEGNWRRDGPLLLVVSREFLEEKGLGPSVAPWYLNMSGVQG